MSENSTLQITLRQAQEILHLANRARRLRPATLDFYQVNTSRFLVWCELHGVTLVDQVTAEVIRRYLLDCSHLAEHTQHKHARVVRRFVRFCAAEKLIAEAPVVDMPKYDTALPTSFTKAEIQTILKTCATERDRIICTVLLDTGLRSAELLALDVGDVDLSDGVITVKHTKTGKGRLAYLAPETIKALAKFLLLSSGNPDKRQPLFLSDKTKRRLTDVGLLHMMARLRKSTGIPHLSAHTFRRSFAIWMLRSGASVLHVQRLMGHKSIRTLERYIGLTDADLRGAHDQGSPIEMLRR